MDTLEWLSRYANFFNPESVYLMLTAFKEIFGGADLNYRNAYISASHNSDSIFILVNSIKVDLLRASNAQLSGQISSSITFQKNLTGQAGVMMTNDNRIAFNLNLMEPLLVNEMNNEIAIASGLLETLVGLVMTQDVNAKPSAGGMMLPQQTLRPYVKFALRCLTSSIRTDAACNRVILKLTNVVVLRD
jgi:hypothetical protein